MEGEEREEKIDALKFKINLIHDFMAGDKKSASKGASESPMSLQPASCFEEKVYTSHQSYFTKQEDIDTVLRLFGISGIETRAPGPNDRMNTPPEGFFAFTPLHIYHSCYLPFNPIIHNVLSFLKIAPIQLNPNSYSYINSLFILFREPKLDELTPSILCSLVTLQKMKYQPEGSIYYLSSVNSGVVTDFINRPRDWSHQFFFVRCYSSDITGRFSVPAIESKNVNPQVPAKIPSFEDSTSYSRSRLRLLTEEKLRKYSLILPTHRVLGEPPMMKKKRNHPPSLVADKLDVFSSNSPVQRTLIERPIYSSDPSKVHLVRVDALLPSKDTSELPSSSKETWKATASKITSPSVVSTAEDAIAKAREDLKRKSSKAAIALCEVPSKRPKGDGLIAPLVPVPSSGTIAIVTALPVQGSAANVCGPPLRQSTASFHRTSGPEAPLEDIPIFLPGSGSSCSANFLDLFTKVLRSSLFASPSSSDTTPSFSAESLENLLQHLIQIGRRLFEFQQSCTSSSQDMTKSQELKSLLSEKIPILETQLRDLRTDNELLSNEKMEITTSLKLEKEKSEKLEKKARLLEENLEKTRELEKSVQFLEDKLFQARLENSTLKTSLARIPSLEKDLDEKNLSISKLELSLYAMKSKVSSFRNDILPQWKEQCAETVLFTTYRDNVELCPNMTFTSFNNPMMDYRRRFDILLGRIPGDYSEVAGDEVIDPAKFLAFDDIPEEDNDEGLSNLGADKENEDDDDEDDNGGNDDTDGPSVKDFPGGNGNGDPNQGRFGNPQGSGHTSYFPSPETAKDVDKSPPSRHSPSKSKPLESGEIGQTPAKAQLPLEAQTPSNVPSVRSFGPSATGTPPKERKG